MLTVRFAPSPTGYLHIGNIRIALWNWLIAKREGGRFILRFDDTDRERSKERFAAAAVEDLAWLGIHPDVIVRQSDRMADYGAALDHLRAAGHVYPAYETAEELERKRRRQQAMGRPPLYDRAALRLTADERQALEAGGRRPHWRLKLSGARREWNDGVRGMQHIETSAMSDPVLVREDGTVLYTFASVVDDAAMGVTDVIRGEDHVANTAVQLELFAALGRDPPRFSHINLIASASGEEMSKRTGGLSVRSFREAGLEPTAVAAVAAITGTAHAVPAVQTLDALMPLATLASVSRALTRFDPAEIADLSARVVHQLPFDAVREAAREAGVPSSHAEAFWLAIRANLRARAELQDWATIIFGPITPRIENAAFTSAAIDLLPPEPFDQATWGIWTNAIKAQTGATGRALFMPLRLALTGREAGPELAGLLPLMGRAKVLARLRGQTA